MWTQNYSIFSEAASPYKLAKRARAPRPAVAFSDKLFSWCQRPQRLLGGCNLFCSDCYQCSHGRAQLVGRVQKISCRVGSSINMLGNCVLGETLGPAEALHVFLHFKTLSDRGLPLRVPLLSHAIYFFIKTASRTSYFPCHYLFLLPSSPTRLREAPRVLDFAQYDHNMFSSTDVTPDVNCPDGRPD